jgi:hypothetical protein
MTDGTLTSLQSALDLADRVTVEEVDAEIRRQEGRLDILKAFRDVVAGRVPPQPRPGPEPEPLLLPGKVVPPPDHMTAEPAEATPAEATPEEATPEEIAAERRRAVRIVGKRRSAAIFLKERGDCNVPVVPTLAIMRACKIGPREVRDVLDHPWFILCHGGYAITPAGEKAVASFGLDGGANE